MADPQRNVAALVLQHAREHPDRLAIVVPVPRGANSLTFGQLAARMEQLADAMTAAGLRRGDRVALLFPLSTDFYALALALMARGLVVVLIDGALDRRRMVRALAAARPRAVVSVRAVLRLWPLLPVLWRCKLISVDGAAFGVRDLAALSPSRDRQGAGPTTAQPSGASQVADPPVPLPDGRGSDRSGELSPEPADDDTPALITFTSGSTGKPKGAERPHGVLLAQHHALNEEFPPAADDVDMPCFPAVVLHNLCAGMTSVLPPGDLRQPHRINPTLVFDAMRGWKVTRISGAPAYMQNLVDHMAAHPHPPVPPLRVVAVGGAPVHKRLCRDLQRVWPDADVRVLYGSTEAEPIASATAREVIDANGDGLFVGRVAPVATVRLVDGEIQVSGPHVVRRYANDAAATAATKLNENGVIWHRTGDIARRDEHGLWLLGRAGDEIPIQASRGRQSREGKSAGALLEDPSGSTRDVIERSSATSPPGTDVPGSPGCATGVRWPLVIEAQAMEHDAVAVAAFLATREHPTGELIVQLRNTRNADVATEITQRTGLPVRIVSQIPMDARHASKVLRGELRRLLEASE